MSTGSNSRSTSPFGSSLLSHVDCGIPLLDVELSNVPKEILDMEVTEVLNSVEHGEWLAGFLEKLGSMETKTESKEMILSQCTRAIFCYGTLRADYTPDGDRWGVIRDLRDAGAECHWSYGTTHGFSLFQDPKLNFPFCTPSDKEEAKIYGTLLSWPADDDIFAQAMQLCNSIEGYEIGGSGLYNRKVVEVEVENSVGDKKKAAYIYFQDKPASFNFSSCLSFPTGDWLESRKKNKK